MSEWIGIDIKPKKNQVILVSFKKQKNSKPKVEMAMYCVEQDEQPCFIVDDIFEPDNVTHWMPLPEPPK